MVERAEKVADGTRPVKKDRFVKIDGAAREVDWDLVERARQLAGLKGYVTNIGTDTMTGSAVIAAYHDLWQVEQSFRMAKTDLRARPIFHRLKDSIEAHLTVVFAALAISRHLKTPPARPSRASCGRCGRCGPCGSTSAATSSPPRPPSPPRPASSSTSSPRSTRRGTKPVQLRSGPTSPIPDG